jgi:hypothetical protein
MIQALNYLIVLVAFLALLNVGSLALWRALRIASRPVPKECSKQVFLLVIAGGSTACLVMLAASAVLYRLAMQCLGL